MKKVLFGLILVLLLAMVGCEENKEEKTNLRDEALKNMNDNLDNILATDSITNIWHIEDHIIDGEELNKKRLFRFADEYVMDDKKFESLNGYEKGLAMKTILIVIKILEGEFEDVENT